MKTIFCQFLDGQDKDGTIKIKPLGKARNQILKPMLPGWKNVVTEIVIDKKYAKGLDGIEDYSHVIIVYWMDKEKECHLKHHPQGREEIPYVGIFACRCPQRPNRIAISTVELIGRKGNVVKVKGLDIVSGTPILDIKPYTPQYDEVKEAKVPVWVSKLVF
ncbi:tRNA (N6-threonylcarbamoyladenosine(37)-N6)-methyltransferase TrmO [Candidatus Daviesbacteria bacterium RIFCSPHIGHO2_01_FULL_40_11]|uniref:tRNA (N6-threonylcarbamoyladenosine(37)-N6)-methyltransferase TrmO n=1 Tax=Candidatus Daviesbacteria bacterium RIFCSPHIGHO2_01_FULL_40_11 TaxID=1797762 RepID=A0A1F5JLY5_9BACT|nr:MAG: tRNA (N6-threonylcarbamoyladenosine(37)-N6)-methyltransferase TrmO [Candidatus Daviesbacteria bacterium RIFCSPHIGHO2_01_FULL_40_11]